MKMNKILRCMFIITFATMLMANAATRRALLVGINNYSPSWGVSSLNGCINDANGIRNTMMLADPSGRWLSGNLQTKTDSGATKASIRAAFQALATQSTAGDTVVYFHSSHGGQTSGTSTFICAYDDVYRDTEFGADLARFNSAVNVIVIVDTCNSAGLFKGENSWPFIENAMASYRAVKTLSLTKAGLPIPKAFGANIAFMVACDYNQSSWEDNSSGSSYGLYSYSLILGCSTLSVDANSDGEYQFMELFNYAKTRTSSSQTAQYLNSALLSSLAARASRYADPYEPDDTSATAKWISDGETQNRSIQVVGDVDWVKFSLTQTCSVEIKTQTRSGFNSGDTLMTLYGPNNPTLGIVTDDDSGDGLWSKISRPGLVAGTYYVAITRYDNNAIIPAYQLVFNTSVDKPVYRFWSPVFRGHFFTISPTERNNIIATLSSHWTYEGATYNAYSLQVAGSLPVYRFWSPVFSGHFFTINETEKNNIISGLSAYWTYEGVAWYAYPTPVAGSVPVYRFWSPVFAHHFFTANETEKNNIIGGLSAYWTYEGVAYYALAPRTVSDSRAENSPLDQQDFAALQKSMDGAAVVSEVEMPVDSDRTSDVFGTGLGDVIFPLSYAGGAVNATIFDTITEKWTSVLGNRDSQTEAVFTDVQPGREYGFEVWTDDPAGSDAVSLHASSFTWQLDPPATLNGDATLVEADAIVGAPVARLKTPATDGTLTLKLYSSSQGVIETQEKISGGDAVEFSLPAWNRWYWVGGWRDSDNALVMSLWMRYTTED